MPGMVENEYELLDMPQLNEEKKSSLSIIHSNSSNYSLKLFGILLIGILIWCFSLYFSFNYGKTLSSTSNTVIDSISQSSISSSSPLLPIIPQKITKPSPPKDSLGTELKWSDNIIEIDFEIEGKEDFTGLAKLCQFETNWNENRWFQCDPIQGGVGNIRNSVLGCLRYTISAGASLVMPTLYLRGALEDPALNLHTGGIGGLDYMFDVEHFKKSLKVNCPLLKLVDKKEDIPGFNDSTIIVGPFRPRDVYSAATNLAVDPIQDFNHHTDSFRKDFDKINGGIESAIKLYRLGFSLFEWEITKDELSLWQNFGRLLKFREDTRLLASQVYSQLGRLKKATTSSSKKRKNEYFGCHLRSEADAPPSWTNVNEQMTQYILQTKSSELSIIFVASGDANEIIKLRNLALKDNLIVVGKTDLLSSLSLDYLTGVTFDQGALIDYLILLKSTRFAGIGHSSFSQSIASRRHLLARFKKNIMPVIGDELSLLLDAEMSPVFHSTTWP